MASSPSAPPGTLLADGSTTLVESVTNHADKDAIPTLFVRSPMDCIMNTTAPETLHSMHSVQCLSGPSNKRHRSPSARLHVDRQDTIAARDAVDIINESFHLGFSRSGSSKKTAARRACRNIQSARCSTLPYASS